MTFRWLSTLFILLLLGGCAVGPDYQRPDFRQPLPPNWQRSDTGEDTRETTRETPGGERERWWRTFGDPVLDDLVEQALRHNNDLVAAAGRVLEAEAALGGARSSQWPTLEVGGSVSRNKSSQATGPAFGSPRYDSFSATATARYTLDLWGRIARGKEAAAAGLLAHESDRRALVQNIIARVVNTWLEIRELELQVDLNERTVNNFQTNLETVEARYRRGLVSALDVHLAGQNLAGAQAQGPPLRQNLAAARRRLEILVGRYPAGTLGTGARHGLPRPLPRPLPPPLPPVPTGLPSELLERRPDLAAAEMRLHAATAGIGQAKAALYPSISLTANGGSSSAQLGQLFTQPSGLWSLIGNIFMPVLNRGAYQMQVKTAEARALQAAAAYHAAVLKAFGEVENALDQDHFQAEQESYLIASVERAQHAVALAEDRYRRGLDNILITLDSQRRLHNAESRLLTTQRLRRAARVNLILALGGPWGQEEDSRENKNPENRAPGAPADNQGVDTP
ncbi:hypothetical protein CSB20_07520 [bacterium DOLZORAL124_64_63]|nr:MAG: hypothetical protein CSB20_07520 [bacterium DOLZORAL124_64_63]